jgi:drug/metabolite transporter (DMT)-like permease
VSAGEKVPDASRTAAGAPEVQGASPAAEAASRMERWGAAVAPGVRYMVAGAFFFSIMSLMVKAVGMRLPSQQVVLVRSAIMLALCFWTMKHLRIDRWGTNRRLLVVRGVMGFLALSAFYYAVIHLPLADATVIQYTNPVFAALLAARFLGERIGVRLGASVAVSLVGVLLVARPSFLFGGGAGPPPLAVAIGLGGAVFSGMAYVAVRRLGQTDHPLVIIFYFSLVSVVGSLPSAVPRWVWPTAMEWLLLLGVGVTTQAGQVFLTRGLRLEPAGRATAIGYLQIVFAAAWGALFFAEIPDAATLAGTALIVGGTLALAVRRTSGRAAM